MQIAVNSRTEYIYRLMDGSEALSVRAMEITDDVKRGQIDGQAYDSFGRQVLAESLRAFMQDAHPGLAYTGVDWLAIADAWLEQSI
jgi:hypothetical protein